MKEVVISTHFNAPCQRVFACITEPRKPFLTRNPVTRMQVIGEQTSGIGTVYSWTFRLPFGLLFQFDEVVTEWVEPQRLAYRATSGWQMEAVAALRPEGDGTDQTFTLRYQLTRPWNWLIPRWLVWLGIWFSLANIRRMLVTEEV